MTNIITEIGIPIYPPSRVYLVFDNEFHNNIAFNVIAAYSTQLIVNYNFSFHFSHYILIYYIMQTRCVVVRLF